MKFAAIVFSLSQCLYKEGDNSTIDQAKSYFIPLKGEFRPKHHHITPSNGPSGLRVPKLIKVYAIFLENTP